MSDAQDTLADISVVADITEKLNSFLDSIGIELSVFGLQFTALSIALAACLILILLAWKKTRTARYAAIVGLAPMLLVVGFISYFWLVQWLEPLPDYIAGQVIADDLHDVSVGLLGFRGRPFSAGPDYVDSVSGRFALNYEPRMGDYPRQFVLKKPGCDELVFPISYAGLKSQQRFSLEFICKAPQ